MDDDAATLSIETQIIAIGKGRYCARLLLRRGRLPDAAEGCRQIAFLIAFIIFAIFVAPRQTHALSRHLWCGFQVVQLFLGSSELGVFL